MSEKPEMTQITVYLLPHQIEGLDELARRKGIGRQASIRWAIDAFLMSESSTYRTKQQTDQPIETA